MKDALGPLKPPMDVVDWICRWRPFRVGRGKDKPLKAGCSK
jgi:hypothetical protein